MSELDRLFERAVADGCRRRADADIRGAADRRLVRIRRLYTAVVMCFCMSASSLLVQACVPVPDGRDMRLPAGVSHRQAFAQANLCIEAL